MGRLAAGAIEFDDAEPPAFPERFEILVAHIQPAEIEFRHLSAYFVDHAVKGFIGPVRYIQEAGSPCMIAIRHQVFLLTAGQHFVQPIAVYFL